MDVSLMEDVAQRFLCAECVADDFLQSKIFSEGQHGNCALCGDSTTCLTVVQVAAYVFQRRAQRADKDPEILQETDPREIAEYLLVETFDDVDEDQLSVEDVCDFFEYYAFHVGGDDSRSYGAPAERSY